MTDWSPYSKIGGHTDLHQVGGPLSYALGVAADNQAYALAVDPPSSKMVLLQTCFIPYFNEQLCGT